MPLYGQDRMTPGDAHRPVGQDVGVDLVRRSVWPRSV